MAEFSGSNGEGEVQYKVLTNLLSEAKDKGKTHVTELFQEFNGDGGVQHEVLTDLLSEARDTEYSMATARCSTVLPGVRRRNT